jgi:hypothetical protein
MIGGYVRNAMSHPAVGAGAGFLIGWHALSGSLFGALLAAGTIGTYSQACKMQQAKDAARAAAIASAQACGDPNDPKCKAGAIMAAIAAGKAAMAPPRLPVWASVTIAALVAALVILATKQ